jgi:hypothetical protein
MRNAVIQVFNKALICSLCVCLTSCMYAVPKDRITAMKRVGVVSSRGECAS